MTSSVDSSALKHRVYAAVGELVEDKSLAIGAATVLLGDGSVLDSMRLVELCLLLEDIAADQGFEFDWTSETAMSKSRSIFRTAGALADEFVSQAGAAGAA